MSQDTKEIRDFISQRANSEEYAKFITDLTCRLIDIENGTVCSVAP